MEGTRRDWSLEGSMDKSNGFANSLGGLLGMRLKSLTVECPKCGFPGLATTTWVKGRKTKPLSIFHKGADKVINECKIGEKDAENIRGRVALSRGDLRKLLRRMKTLVLFSGGADSLCTLLYLLDVADGDGANLTAVHVDTTAGFPEVTRYVRRICKQIGIPLEIVRAKREYFELAKRWGIPSFNARWCCKELKVKPVRDFLKSVPEPKMVVDGIRAVESNQRSTYLPVWYHPEFRCISVSPLLDWSDEDVMSRIETSGLPESPAKCLGCSAECWCGAYKTRADFEKLLEIHPEIFDKLVEVEKAQRGRFTFIYENGNQVPLESLKKG